MKFKQEIEGENGWCDWVYPLHGHGKRNYKLACCDCGLVHDFQFRVIKDSKGRNSVILRARRNNRSTAMMRRNKKH